MVNSRALSQVQACSSGDVGALLLAAMERGVGLGIRLRRSGSLGGELVRRLANLSGDGESAA